MQDTAQDFLSALLALGGSWISVEPETLAVHSGDSMVQAGEGAGPVAVAFPTLTRDVAQLLRLCNRYGVAVVPQGGLTGYSGGATPSAGSVAISLSRMTSVRSLDVDGATITVEAGAILQSVQDAAAAVDMMIPVDLGARGTCTIGGIAATNAGGNRVLRYGMTRDMVLGLEVVLPDGTVIEAMNTMLKNNTGYDLKQLFIGSEGTLGVITSVVCKLVPRPSSLSAALCGVVDYDAAMRLLRHARARLGTALSAFEVMWPDFYSLAVREQPAPLAPTHGLYVLLDMLGSDPASDGERFESVIAASLNAGIVDDAVVAQSRDQANRLWALRESTGSFRRTIGPRVPFDISIPTAAIGGFVDEVRQRLQRRWPDVLAVFFGHVADSNIHLAVALANGITAHEVERLVYPLVGERGGSVSAEHGIGLTKTAFLRLSRTADEIALMKRVKLMLDPTGICNPGKILGLAEG